MRKRKETAAGKTGKKSKGPNPRQIERQIRSIIAEVLEVDVKKITPDAKFAEDLGMDSMKALEILAGIERAYKIEVPEEALPKIVDFKEVMNLTRELLLAKK